MKKRFSLLVAALLIGLTGHRDGTVAAQANSLALVAWTDGLTPRCVITRWEQVTARSADFVEWTTDFGTARVAMAAGVKLLRVDNSYDVPRAAAYLGLDAATCAR